MLLLEHGRLNLDPDVTHNYFDALPLLSHDHHLLKVLDVIFCLVFKIKKMKHNFVLNILEEFHNAF